MNHSSIFPQQIYKGERLRYAHMKRRAINFSNMRK